MKTREKEFPLNLHLLVMLFWVIESHHQQPLVTFPVCFVGQWTANLYPGPKMIQNQIWGYFDGTISLFLNHILFALVIKQPFLSQRIIWCNHKPRDNSLSKNMLSPCTNLFRTPKALGPTSQRIIKQKTHQWPYCRLCWDYVKIIQNPYWKNMFFLFNPDRIHQSMFHPWGKHQQTSCGVNIPGNKSIDPTGIGHHIQQIMQIWTTPIKTTPTRNSGLIRPY